MTIKASFSQLQRCVFLDKNNVEIGSIEDLVLDEKLYPTHLVLGSGFYEEFLEEVGDRDNIDELAELSLIKKIDNDTYKIKEPVENLPKTDINGRIGGKLFLSDLREFPVFILDCINPIRIIDYIVDKNPYFVFDDFNIHQKLRDKGINTRFYLYAKPEKISIKQYESSKKIIVDISIDELADKVRKLKKSDMRQKIFI